MVGPKKQAFWPRINIHRAILKKSFDELQYIEKVPKSYFKVNFRCQKSMNFFQKRKLFENINLGDRFLVNLFFLNSTF